MYTRVIRAMVRSQQPHMAVQLACEAHTLGALHHYALPDLGQGPPLPGTALGNVVDLRCVWGGGGVGGVVGLEGGHSSRRCCFASTPSRRPPVCSGELRQ